MKRLGNLLVDGLNEASRKSHKLTAQKGFWDIPREIGTLLMLVTSELGEALEADREGKYARLADFEAALVMHEKKYGQRMTDESYMEIFKGFMKDTFEDEIADVMLRLLDLVGNMNIDIEKHIEYKHYYNSLRKNKHGKKY